MASATAHPFCPRCWTALGETGEGCPACGLAFERRGGLLDVLGSSAREAPAAEVEAFYDRHPFPGYAPGDDGARLLDRGRAIPFAAALDDSIPPDARVLDCGCGTAQLAAFLALAAPRRRVVGVDGCRESLRCAEEFREGAGIGNLQLVRADLFDLPLASGDFPVVLCRGVVHHTPDPDAAIARVADYVAPGGVLVLGFYETWGRWFHGLRRRLGRLAGREVRWLDPVLRRRDVDDEKKRTWIQDQYRHPLEHVLSLPRVLQVLRGLGLQWVRTIPPLPPGANPLERTAEPGPGSLRVRRLGWALRGVNDPDAGLVAVVVRKGARAAVQERSRS